MQSLTRLSILLLSDSLSVFQSRDHRKTNSEHHQGAGLGGLGNQRQAVDFELCGCDSINLESLDGGCRKRRDRYKIDGATWKSIALT